MAEAPPYNFEVPLFEIAKYFAPWTLCRCAALSTAWRALADHPDLWRAAVARLRPAQRLRFPGASKSRVLASLGAVRCAACGMLTLAPLRARAGSMSSSAAVRAEDEAFQRPMGFDAVAPCVCCGAMVAMSAPPSAVRGATQRGGGGDGGDGDGDVAQAGPQAPLPQAPPLNPRDVWAAMQQARDDALTGYGQAQRRIRRDRGRRRRQRRERGGGRR